MNTQHTPGATNAAWRILSEGGAQGKMSANDLADIIDRETSAPALLSDNAALRQALRDVFGLMDQEWLVRDITHDAEPGFAMRQLEPMMKLAKARAALERGSK